MVAATEEKSSPARAAAVMCSSSLCVGSSRTHDMSAEIAGEWGAASRSDMGAGRGMMINSVSVTLSCFARVIRGLLT